MENFRRLIQTDGATVLIWRRLQEMATCAALWLNSHEAEVAFLRTLQDSIGLGLVKLAQSNKTSIIYAV